MDWLNTVAELTDPRIAVAEINMATTEYVYNSAAQRLSHLVVEDTFSDYGDAATICGLVVTSADLFPNYDLCAECTERSRDGNGG